jgi:hypothetical protein
MVEVFMIGYTKQLLLNKGLQKIFKMKIRMILLEEEEIVLDLM